MEVDALRSRAFAPACVAMDTWSSCPAEVGTVSTLAGQASALFSDTRAAAVTCAIMKPLLAPLSRVRKGGRPLILGSTRIAVRRSLIEAISHKAIVRMSAVNATGSAWKLPPDTASSPKMIGLSVTAFASMVSVPATWRSRSSAAPITCGWQRKL
jgi:hypothetical protein